MSTLKHTPSTVAIFTSNNYDDFSMIKGNRNLDTGKIKRILRDIERGTNLLKYCPILVVVKNEKLEIIDGQHRYMVAMKVKSPVYYVIAEDLSLYDIAKMNSNQEKWKADDFINCYVQLGNINYIKLQQFKKKFAGLPTTSAITLLSSGRANTGGAADMEKFHRGEFVATCEDAAIELMDLVSEFNFEHKYSRGFLVAIWKVKNAGMYPIQDLIEKVNGYPQALQLQDHYKRYLTNLEEIASKGKHKKVSIW